MRQDLGNDQSIGLFKSRKFYIWIFCAAAIIVILLCIGFLSMHFVKRDIQNKRGEIQKQLEAQFGLPVSFSSVSAHWVGASLSVNLSNVVIYDKPEPIPFISMEALELRSSIFSLIKNLGFNFDTLVINKLQMVLGWEKNKSLGMLGLKGEYLPSSIDYQSLLDNFEGRKIRLKEAQIHWWGPGTSIIQYLNGTLEGNKASETIKFVGKERLNLGTHYHLPDSKLNIIIHSKTLDTELSASLLQAKIKCKISNKDNPELHCGIHAEDIDIGPIHRFFELTEGDPAWLRWLTSALEEGEVSKVNLEIMGPLDKLNWQGNIHFEDLDFRYVPGWPELKRAKGSAVFNHQTMKIQVEEAFSGENRENLLEDISATIAPIGGGSDKPLTVNIDGILTSQVLQTQFPMDILKHFQGSSQFVLSYSEADDYWKINTDLEGMRINLPLPFTKAPQTALPTQLILYPTDNREQKLALTIDKILDAKWVNAISEQKQEAVYNKNKDKNKEKDKFNVKYNAKNWIIKKSKPVHQSEAMNIKRGQWVLGGGTSDWISKPVLSISGALAELDLDDWWNLISNEKKEVKTSAIEMNIRANQMLFLGLNFQKSTFGLNFNERIASLSIDSPNLKGSVSLPLAEKSENKEIKIDIIRANIKSDEVKSVDTDKFFSEAERLPINLVCRDLQVDDKWLGSVSVNFIPNKSGYDVKNFSAKTDSYSIAANGQWEISADASKTSIAGEIYSNNIGKTFGYWGFNAGVKEGKGRIQFDLQWPNTPFQFSLKSSIGTAYIKINNGRIIGVDLGLGKLLSLLSIGNIARVLKLDFLKKGFVFDSMKATLQFQDGYVSTEDFTVDGPSARMGAIGNINLSNKNLDLQLVVMPKLAGSILATTGLINPLVGIGAWAFGELVSSQAGALTQHYYKVTGPWDAPNIQEMGASKSSRRRRSR